VNLRVRFPHLQHFNWVTFYPRGFQLFIEKDDTWAGESIGDTDLILIRAAPPCSLYTHNRAKSREVLCYENGLTFDWK
jgi:hypothetical protein